MMGREFAMRNRNSDGVRVHFENWEKRERNV